MTLVVVSIGLSRVFSILHSILAVVGDNLIGVSFYPAYLPLTRRGDRHKPNLSNFGLPKKQSSTLAISDFNRVVY